MAKSDMTSYETDTLIIAINRSACISCGICQAIAPNTFELDEKLISRVKKEGPWNENQTILEAAQSCAVSAMTLIDKKTGRKLWPK